MKRFFLFLCMGICAWALNAQSTVMICDFDDVYPTVTTSNLSFSLGDADEAPASGKVGVFEVPGTNTGSNYFVLTLDEPIDPRDCLAISLDAKAPAGVNFAFCLKLEQSTDPTNSAQIQDLGYNYSFSGNGAWKGFKIPLDRILTNLESKMSADPNLDPTKYDKIVIVTGYYQNHGAFTLYVDNIQLETPDAPIVIEPWTDILVCNYDDVFPTPVVSSALESAVDYEEDAPAGSPASGKVLTITVPNSNDASKAFGVELPFKFDPRNYKGISFLAQIDHPTANPRIGLRLEQSTYQNYGDYAPGRIRNIASAEIGRYTGLGEWQEVFVSFETMTSDDPAWATQTGNIENIWKKIADDPDFQPDQFDRILMVIAPYSSTSPGYTMQIDDIVLIAKEKPEEPKEDLIMLCDFDEIPTDVANKTASGGGVSHEIVTAEARPATGNMLSVAVPANNGGGYFNIILDETFDPDDYLGISFDVKATVPNAFRFVPKLQSTADAMNTYVLQDWDSWNHVQYTGAGEWSRAYITFSRLTGTPMENPQYNKIELVPASYNNISPGFTLYIDNIRLHRISWDLPEEPAEPENTLICNFDDVVPDVDPFITYGGITGNYNTDAPADVPASGKILTLNSPGGNTAGNWFTVWTDFTFDPRDYVGVSFLAKVPEGLDLHFGFRLQQSTDGNNDYALQNLTYYEEYDAGQYTGDGKWQEVHLTFAHMTLEEFSIPYRQPAVPESPLRSTGNVTNIWDRIAANSNYPVDQFDKISVALSPNINIGVHTLLIDNIRLRVDTEDLEEKDLTNGIIRIENANAIRIATVNGMISARASDGSPVALKVYTPLGQEVVSGIDQVPVATKGVYIVKASVGAVSSIRKMIVP